MKHTSGADHKNHLGTRAISCIPKWSLVNLRQQWGSCTVITVYLCHIKYTSALLAVHILSYKCCSKPFSHKISELNKILKSQKSELGVFEKSFRPVSRPDKLYLSITFLSFQINRWPGVAHQWLEKPQTRKSWIKILPSKTLVREECLQLWKVNYAWVFC